MSVYVNMPQNDKRQIEQILKEYEQDPAKGLAHGVQKDAIQNGFGARKRKSEVKACRKDWKFFFELKTINGKPALIFWDEGTTGLTGDILSSEEIEERSSSGGLGSDHPNQKLGRFLTRFESGGNTGPGSFGRGKLIFQAASQSLSILIDSLREDDDQHIALDRKVIGNQLKQPDRPYVGNEALEFISSETNKALDPLSKHGTRITILEVDSEIVDAFNLTFDENDSRNDPESFYHMVAETWWEILQMGANIYLIKDGAELQVAVEGDLDRIIQSENTVSGYSVFREKNIPVSVNDVTHKIKELKLVVSPHTITEEYREIWVQRKRMKIGGIDRRVNKHHKIQKKLSGYIRLDSELETLFEKAEGLTHYGFDMRASALRQVKEILDTKVEEFQKQLGFRSENTAGRVQNEMNNALKALNELANDLGLPTEFSEGKRKKAFSISVAEFALPDDSTTRIELGDRIGPIKYKLRNLGSNPATGVLIITCEQGHDVKEVFRQDGIVQPGDTSEITVPEITIGKSDYTAASMMLVRARFKRADTSSIYDQVTRSLWIGIDPPMGDSHDVGISVSKPKFPRKETPRVELGEVIEGLGFTLTNRRNIDLKLKIDVKVRKCKSADSDVMELRSVFSESEYLLPAMSDAEVDLEDLNISSEIFKRVWAEPAVDDLRKCEVFFSIRFAETYEYLERLKGDYAAAKKSILFYCGVDPAGQSIFKKTDQIHDPSDARRAFVRGDRTQGYTFVLNIGHYAYKYVEAQGPDIRETYFQEQMIFHAATLAVRNEVFEGPIAEFKEMFSDNEIPPHESALKIDEIVGSILQKFRG